MNIIKTSSNKNSKKLYIKTWGCQMNVYDSARMADVVAHLGYLATDNVAEADLVIFNTCHIREKATEKLFSELGRLRDHQKARAAEGHRMMIAVAGCVAQGIGKEIQRRAPYVDMVFGPQTYHKLPEMIAKIERSHGKVLDTDFPPESKFDFLPHSQADRGISAFLSVQEGCDKFCSYCVVPYTRGSEYSRPMDDIITEAELLVKNGAKEITLLGQNVNALQGGLTKLLWRLSDINDLKRLRYMTSHPCDMDDELIAAHRDMPKLMPFLHLPVQSGSDNILNAMNRKHTADDYRRTINKLRKARPDIGLSSDFIIGFPGESDADFQETMRLVRDIGFAQTYSFKYSRRPGTPAAAMANQVAESVKNERLTELQLLLRQQQDDFNQACLNRTMPVLFDGLSRRKGHLFGRTPYMQAIFVKGDENMLGKELNVTVNKTSTNSLTGSLANPERI